MSIGFAINKVPVVGVVYNPIINELFSAAKGKGAFLNGKPIHVSKTENLKVNDRYFIDEVEKMLNSGRSAENLDTVNLKRI